MLLISVLVRGFGNQHAIMLYLDTVQRAVLYFIDLRLGKL